MEDKKIIIAGYYGFRNAGDEAVLAALVQILRCEFPGVQLVALSSAPEKTAQVYGISAIDRRNRGAIKKELSTASLFISGGGSLFQDVTSVRSVYYYASMLNLAHRAGVPAVVLAQGLGPLNTKLGRWMTRRAMAPCRFLSWRDGDSLALAEEIGLPREKMYPTCDPVLLWNPTIVSDKKTETTGGSKEIAFALRPWKTLNITPVIAAIEGLQQRGFSVALVPLHGGVDDIQAAEINGQLKNPVPVADSDPQGVYAALKGADCVVGMRLHSLIMATAAGTPSVAISYDPKIDGFAQLAEIPVVGTAATVTQEGIIQGVLAELERESAENRDRFEALWQVPLEKIKEILG